MDTNDIVLPISPGASIATYSHCRCAIITTSMTSCASTGAAQLMSISRSSLNPLVCLRLFLPFIHAIVGNADERVQAETMVVVGG